MAVPFIQIGQCGNQIGKNFYEIMHSEGTKASLAHQGLLSQFFTVEQDKRDQPKAFLIDMEPKVVNRNLTQRANWQYDPKMSLVRQEGSGNNWAYGCKIHGPSIMEDLSQLFRRWAERQDSIKCFVQMQSMAGGTGSGVGTFILTLLNEMFEKIPKFVISVMPHTSGEVILQSYNASLCLSTIYHQADGIFVIHNDNINSICVKDLKISKPSLQDINQVIARNIASVFFPVVSRFTPFIYSTEQNQFNYPITLCSHLFADTRYKLSSIYTAPNGPKDSQSFNFDSWTAIYSQLTRRKMRSTARLMIMRGNDHMPLGAALEDRHPFYGYSRSGTILSNGQQCIEGMETMLERGYEMLKEGAYVHQYMKYGLERQQLVECFAQMEVIHNYYKRI